ncbi:hypothetical protein BOTBODRAFT_33260 [Botryobasidium botryosum FD-172 SS1]|uniref:Uncharacterized protein n=1 Tax=Botryobasidium botryosum (strain FD-172 SS1) TaxID=930990 RepID=A0A067ME85_BOTB1|nr:hypothetical protein BOTBODRAFT_33260 [Botryobasidium botryosum FD-172 SS1]
MRALRTRRPYEDRSREADLRAPKVATSSYYITLWICLRVLHGCRVYGSLFIVRVLGERLSSAFTAVTRQP